MGTVPQQNGDSPLLEKGKRTVIRNLALALAALTFSCTAAEAAAEPGALMATRLIEEGAKRGGVKADAPLVWRAAEPDGRSVVLPLADGEALRIDVLAADLLRVRKSVKGEWSESGLNRYGVFRRDWPETAFVKAGDGIETAAARLSLDGKTGRLSFKSKVSAAEVTIDPESAGGGYALGFSLAGGERVYGLGDASRAELMRRGKRYDFWVKNATCYIPVPFAWTDRGWGVVNNSTWRHAWDVGAADPAKMRVEAPRGTVDFYLITGRDNRAILEAYTRLSGRPALLPVWAYGLTFVANQEVDQYRVIDECMEFRRQGMPCDLYSLEPGWMQKDYDLSIYKEWNESRFTFPFFNPLYKAWIGAMNRLGFKLSLWLCCDYDLFRYEEERLGGAQTGVSVSRAQAGVPVPRGEDGAFDDERIGFRTNRTAAVKSRHANVMYRKLYCPEDKVPDGELPWFEHLKKFVDQGAQAFKLDACNQIGEHPDRAWANGRGDEEMHNLFPVVYDKQMSEGLEKHLGVRPMIFSAGGYAGVQRYVATWAGDTGGGAKTLTSILNLGLSGHSNQSCDMDIYNPAALHFGFLQTWSQLNNWCYWKQPWLQAPERVEVFRKYDRLRYRLLPYIYSAAAVASRTGYPVMRALALEYPDRREYDGVQTTYMFGPDLLVSAFAPETVIPPGKWHEWRTDAAVTGPGTQPVDQKDFTWGGGLYVRSGAIIPTWPVKDHLEKGWNDEVTLEIWPTADGRTTLYLDDGVSLDYRDGGYLLREFTMKAAGDRIDFSVARAEGRSAAVPREADLTLRFHALNAAPKAVTVDGKPVTGVYDAATRTFTLSLGRVAAAEIRLFSATATAAETARTLAEDFADPPTVRGALAWWHWCEGDVSKAGITRDLEAMKSAGLAGATIFHSNCGYGPETDLQPDFRYHSEAWWDHLAFASREAKRLGLELGMQNCPGYSASGGPWITPETAMKRLVCSTNGLPPEVTLGFYRDIATVVTNGVAYRIGYTCTGKLTHPAPKCAAPPLEADKLSRRAMELHWDNVFGEMPRRLALGKPGFSHVFMDSYEAKSCDWTDGFEREFKTRRGYDPVPLLPVLFGAEIGTEAVRTKFRADMKLTVQDLFDCNHFETFYRRAHAIGLEVHLEPYGNGPFDGRRAAAWCDVPYETFWARPTFWQKDAGAFGADARWLTELVRARGRRLVGCESFTCMPQDDMWTMSPRKLKRQLDATYARGVNLIALHHWVHQPLDPSVRPGFSMGWWGVHFGQCQTWFDIGKDFYRYMGRCQALLQRGDEAVEPVRILAGGEDRRAYATQRREGDLAFAFVCNSSTNCNAVRVGLLNPAAAPAQIWFPATGRRFVYPEASVTSADGWSTLTLPLAPLESAFVVFASPETALPTLDPAEGQWRRGEERVLGGFTLSLAGKTIENAEGRCWTSLSDRETRTFSGEAVYTATVELDVAPPPEAYLDLGAVRDVAEVSVNGRRLGAVWYEPFRLFVGDALRKGRNTVEIRVANCWANRLIGEAALPRDYELWPPQTAADFGRVTESPVGAGVRRLPDWALGKAPRTSGRTAFCTWDYYPDGGRLQPSGLLGPVRLIQRRNQP